MLAATTGCAYPVCMTFALNRTHVHAHTDAPRRRREPVNVSIDPDLLEQARALGIPLSATFEAALRERVREAVGAAWLRENADAIEDYNARVQRDGVFSDGLRRF